MVLNQGKGPRIGTELLEYGGSVEVGSPVVNLERVIGFG